MAERTCLVCGVTKPITAFNKTTSAGNGKKYHRRECRQCTYKRQENWRRRNADRLRALSYAATMRMRKRRLAADPIGFRAEEARKAKAYRESLKARVYAAYGGYRCACCGETQPKFLSIDHVNNDGYQRRKNRGHGAGAGIYLYLWRQFKKNESWPDDFQVLCMNCQHGKARNGGICPHKESVTTRAKARRAKRPEAHRTP